MNLFITGITGFCGHHITKHLLSSGHNIIGAVRSNNVNKVRCFEKNDNFTLFKTDLLRFSEFPSKVDAIIHIAATSPDFGKDVNNFINDNIIVTQNIINAAYNSNVNKIIFFSSISVNGEVDGSIVDESTPILNPSTYGLSKRIGELMLLENSNSINSIAFRLPSIIGKGASRHWLANMLNKAKSNQDINIYNPDAHFNNAVHIINLCIFVDRLLKVNWDGFDFLTLGSDGYLTIRDIVELIVKKTQSKSKIVICPETRSHFTISNKKACDVYEFQPSNFETILNSYLNDSVIKK